MVRSDTHLGGRNSCIAATTSDASCLSLADSTQLPPSRKTSIVLYISALAPAFIFLWILDNCRERSLYRLHYPEENLALQRGSPRRLVEHNRRRTGLQGNSLLAEFDPDHDRLTSFLCLVGQREIGIGR